MFRILQTGLHANVDAMNKAGSAMKTGMGVVKNLASKTAELPSAETAEDIFFVDKERVPTGTNCALSDMSDYHENFIDIGVNEMVTLYKGAVGGRYAVDQCVPMGLTVNDRMAVNTSGMWVKATGESRYVYGGEYNDAGHTLYIIEVSDTVK